MHRFFSMLSWNQGSFPSRMIAVRKPDGVFRSLLQTPPIRTMRKSRWTIPQVRSSSRGLDRRFHRGRHTVPTATRPRRRAALLRRVDSYRPCSLRFIIPVSRSSIQRSTSIPALSGEILPRLRLSPIRQRSRTTTTQSTCLGTRRSTTSPA